MISHFCACGCEICCVRLLQVSKGPGGELEGPGRGAEQAAVCYAPSHKPCQHQTLALPLPPLSLKACPLADAKPACLPCHARCPCWNVVGESPSPFLPAFTEQNMGISRI